LAIKNLRRLPGAALLFEPEPELEPEPISKTPATSDPMLKALHIRDAVEADLPGLLHLFESSGLDTPGQGDLESLRRA